MAVRKGSCNFAAKMSNPAFMSVCIEGDRQQIRSLHGKMLRLQNRKEPLIDNGFYYPKRWLGNLVARLGADYHEVFCRGTWDYLQLHHGVLTFDTETAWVAPFDVLRLIERVYPGVRIYFAADGDGWDWYLTNDREGRYFSCRYELDMPPDNEYYDTIDEVAAKVSAYIGRPIVPTLDAVYAAIEEWEETNEDLDAYINLKEYKIVELSEV